MVAVEDRLKCPRCSTALRKDTLGRWECGYCGTVHVVLLPHRWLKIIREALRLYKDHARAEALEEIRLGGSIRYFDLMSDAKDVELMLWHYDKIVGCDTAWRWDP